MYRDQFLPSTPAHIIWFSVVALLQGVAPCGTHSHSIANMYSHSNAQPPQHTRSAPPGQWQTSGRWSSLLPLTMEPQGDLRVFLCSRLPQQCEALIRNSWKVAPVSTIFIYHSHPTSLVPHPHSPSAVHARCPCWPSGQQGCRQLWAWPWMASSNGVPHTPDPMAHLGRGSWYEASPAAPTSNYQPHHLHSLTTWALTASQPPPGGSFPLYMSVETTNIFQN